MRGVTQSADEEQKRLFRLSSAIHNGIIGCTNRNHVSVLMSSTVGIKLDDATRERLKSVASSLDRAPHWVIKTALIEFLDREEATLREKLEDEDRWAQYQETGRAIPQDRVMQWLDALAQGSREPCPE